MVIHFTVTKGNTLNCGELNVLSDFFYEIMFSEKLSLYLMCWKNEENASSLRATNIVSFDAVSPILVRKQRTHPYFHLKLIRLARRKIRAIEGNTKCLHLKKSTCKGVLQQVFICLKMKTRRLHGSPLPLLYCTFLF